MKERIVNHAVMLYIVVSIAVCCIGRIIPINKLIGTNLNSMMFNLLAFFGAMLLFIDFFTTKCWKKGKNIFVLYGFVCIIFLSSVWNYRYGVVDNVKTIVWTIIQIGLIYTFYNRFDRSEVTIFLNRIWQILNTGWFFPVIYSLYQFMILEKYKTRIDGRYVRQGFYENRLFGIFNDPNYAAVTSLCVMISCVYLLKRVKNKFYDVFLIINLIVQFLYIVLSGSRTAQVCMIVVLGVYGWLRWHINNRKEERTLRKKILGYVCIPFLSAAIVSGAFAVGQKGVLLLPMSYFYLTTGEIPESIQFDGEDELTKRKDGQADNISNNRSTIWKAYLEGMKGDILLGGSPRNVLEKWQEKNPTGYLAETNYETHNGYLYVLVGTGILGLSVLFIYAILYARRVILHVIDTIQLADEFIFIAAILITILTYVFFFTDLFFIHSLTSVLFWLHCGAALHWVDKESSGEEVLVCEQRKGKLQYEK